MNIHVSLLYQEIEEYIILDLSYANKIPVLSSKPYIERNKTPWKTPTQQVDSGLRTIRGNGELSWMSSKKPLGLKFNK